MSKRSQISSAMPSRMRYMLIPQMSMFLPVGGMVMVGPAKSPRWVPVILQRTTSLSPLGDQLQYVVALVGEGLRQHLRAVPVALAPHRSAVERRVGGP
jgi:hypothetical protein